jgi:folate-dependent phosphoribosylglycinamide formyltransferase PurN
MLSLFDDLRVAVLCSHRAPGLDGLLHHPQRGRMYDVACVVTTEPALASRASIEDAGVPVLVHPIRRFHDECGASLKDHSARRAYDALTVHVLEHLDVNAVLMLGYLYIASDVLLNAFRRRIFNIHDGEPHYPGLHATYDAIVAGEPATCSTLHHVTSKLDGGPMVLQSEPYPVAPFVREAVLGGHADIVKAYAYAQREWMMRDSWGELAVRAMETLAAGMYEEVAV